MNPTQKQRAYLYRVTTAAGLIASAYGLISNDDLPLWLGLAAAVLGTGTAAANTTTKEN